MIVMACPMCDEEFEVDRRDAGRRVACPYCKRKVLATEKEQRHKHKSQWPWLLCFFLTLLIAIGNGAMYGSVKNDLNLIALNTTAAFWTFAVFVLAYCADRRS